MIVSFARGDFVNELLQVKSDILFHDLINQDNIKIIEWIVMQILGLSYDDVHGNCKVLDSRITRVFKKDRIKYVDLVIGYQDYEIILELNRNFIGNIIKNIMLIVKKNMKNIIIKMKKE